jgi:AcrR family transcriptional regulator
MTLIQTADADLRRTRILEGALGVFLSYGFQRTTMDDIARAADISRPALYLHFRNKGDIYRALAQLLLSEALEAARQAMDTDAALDKRLHKAVGCVILKMQDIEQSPHGADLLDMKSSLAADIVAEGRGQMGALVENAIAEEAAERDVDLSQKGLSPHFLSDMLLDALDGMKARHATPEEMQVQLSGLIQVIAMTLSR